MNLAELEGLLDNRNSGSEISVELYTRSEVRSGQLTCPDGFRLSDLLNYSFSPERPAENRFLDFVEASRPGDLGAGEGKPKVYVRESAIDLVAVSDGNLGRGIGSNHGKVRVFQEKSPARTSLELGTYTLIGNMHCRPGQTVQDVLNDSAPFLALTDVTMVRDNLVYGTRPFVAVNKREVISCREEG